MLYKHHNGLASSTAAKPKLRLVVSQPEPDPDYRPPQSQADYHDEHPGDGCGKFPSTAIQQMQRRKALRDLRVLHRLRRINEPFEMWIEGGIDVALLYSPYVLGRK